MGLCELHIAKTYYTSVWFDGHDGSYMACPVCLRAAWKKERQAPDERITQLHDENRVTSAIE